eukprot:39264-Chlamydomonas_euryale.AAC.1
MLATLRAARSILRDDSACDGPPFVLRVNVLLARDLGCDMRVVRLASILVERERERDPRSAPRDARAVETTLQGRHNVEVWKLGLSYHCPAVPLGGLPNLATRRGQDRVSRE